MKRYFTWQNAFITICVGYALAAVLNLYVAVQDHRQYDAQQKQQAIVKIANDAETRRCVQQMRRDLRIIRHDLAHIEQMLEN